MTCIPLRYQPGDTLIIRNTDGILQTWKVAQRRMSGWQLKPSGDGDPLTWSDEAIHDAYRDRRITHESCNKQNLSATAANAIEKTWEFWKPEIRRAAERRLAYVRRVAELVGERTILMTAYNKAAEEVYAENFEIWKQEDRDTAAAREAARQAKKRRDPFAERNLDDVAPGPRRPSIASVRRWYEKWNTGRDIKLLIPLHHGRGNKRSRYPKYSSEEIVDTYKLMRTALESHYLNMPRRRKKIAYGEYEDLCRTHQVHCVSFRTFRKFLWKEYDDRTEYERRYGRKAAYLKFNVFERRKPPERPLEEVEVDHCLIDLIVTHPVTGKVLGRPWLTVIMDRATRVILGVHLSFVSPSYATLQRAMAHAMWPKDLRGIPGLCHDWPCHGVWDMLFTDNGKEFHSRSLAVCANALDFRVIPLPAKQPWLKGMIERLWGTIGVQVFSLEEGATLSRTPDHYDPAKRARLSLDEVKTKLLKWIVDEYHHTRHRTLKCTPMERWRELTAIYPVRPVPDFDHVVRLTGQIVKRKIENVGVRYQGHLFTDRDAVTGKTGKKLSALLARRGGRDREWTMRVDPFDLGEIWILDDQEGKWISLPNADPSVSRGVSQYQHKIHRLIAAQNVAPGQAITVRDLEKAKEMAEAEVEKLFTKGAVAATAVRAARYAGDAGYFTPMPAPPERALAHAPQAAAAPSMLGRQRLQVVATTEPDTAAPAPKMAKVAPPSAPAGKAPPPIDFTSLIEKELGEWK